MREDELASYIVAYLEGKGYECYKEVCLRGKGGNIRNDCYAVQKKDGEIVMSLALETKTSFSLKVIQQAFSWKKHANVSYVGVPYSKKKNKLYNFAVDVCQKFGIGIFEVTKQGVVIHSLVAEQQNKKIILPPLYEQQKSSVAGTNSGVFYTSFKHTLSLMNEYTKDKDDWLEIGEVITNIKHHYKTKNGARSAIIKYINSGIIKGYEISVLDNICRIRRSK